MPRNPIPAPMAAWTSQAPLTPQRKLHHNIFPLSRIVCHRTPRTHQWDTPDNSRNTCQSISNMLWRIRTLSVAVVATPWAPEPFPNNIKQWTFTHTKRIQQIFHTDTHPTFRKRRTPCLSGLLPRHVNLRSDCRCLVSSPGFFVI